MSNDEGELEKSLRELGEAKAHLRNAFFQTSVGKFIIASAQFLERMMERWNK